MHSDLDHLMEEANVDTLLVLADEEGNASMRYFTGTVSVGQTLLLKPRGQQPVLYHGSMEREEVKRTGLKTRSMADLGWPRKHLSELASPLAEHLRSLGISGRMAVYGKLEAGPLYAFLGQLESEAGVSIVRKEPREGILRMARMTKTPEEIERMRRVAQSTVAVVGNVADFLTSHRVQNGILIDQHGEPLTIADVKRRIDLWLAMRDLANPDGTIFSVAEETAFPHSVGTASATIPVGKPIIFDIFPCEAGNGMYFDFTRTWCLGRADEALLSLHGDVSACCQATLEAVRPGVAAQHLQHVACDVFERQGHPTLRSHPGTTDGYVHSLGHGLGLQVHEPPILSHVAPEQSSLEANMTFTLEPGLYYPARGLGVRIEDTFWLRPDGQAEVLAEYSHELVLKLPGVQG
jgi:Xaa-Pro aminopeptidase